MVMVTCSRYDFVMVVGAKKWSQGRDGTCSIKHVY